MNHDVLIVARSITQAQRMQKALTQAGYWSRIIRGPREIMDFGCGYAVQLREEEFVPAMQVLKRQGLSAGKAYIRWREHYEEVML